MFECNSERREGVILVIAEIVAAETTFSKDGVYFQAVFRDVDYFTSVTYKFDQETMDRNLFLQIDWDKKYILEIDAGENKVLNAYEKLEVKE